MPMIVSPNPGKGNFVYNAQSGVYNYSGGVATAVDGSKAVVGSIASGGGIQQQAVEIRSSQNPAVLQADELTALNYAGAGGVYVVDLGAVHYFLDMSSTALPIAHVQMIDPNGVPHDLAAFTRTKANAFYFPPGLPPGRYTFTNISGGAQTGTVIFVFHTGARNLA